MKNRIVILFLACGLVACGFSQGKIQEINAEKLIELRDSGIKVVDVRTSEEYREGRIPGAENVILSESFAESLKSHDKNEPVVLYCRSGGRSTNAANQLKSAGFRLVYNYTGSYLDWTGSGRKVEKN